MNRATPQRALSRRSLLKLLGLAGATAIGGYVLYEAAPWLNYDRQANQTWQPNLASPTPAMKDLVRYATLAANGHNTQPWKFVIDGSAIEIHPDWSRRLPVVDPHDRELWISLGCALENLLIAARTQGYAAEVTYPDTADVIRVQLTADKAQPNVLFDAISARQNVRSEYDGQPVKPADLERVMTMPLEPDVSVRWMTQPRDMEDALAYVNEGNLRQYADKAYIAELIQWLRFNKREALAALDGLYSRSSGNMEVPRWIGQWFVASTSPQQQADADAKKLRSSAGAWVIAAARDDKPAWVRTGQVYERMALQMTALNIKSAFLNQPIEVAELRGQFQNALGLKDALPQLLVRFGYAAPMPRSLRRPVEAVLAAVV